MNRQSLRVQWAQLVVLSGVHFIVDMFGNVLPALVPVIRQEFAVTLAVAGFVLASLPLASNGVQILTGHLRPDKTKPFFLYLGVILAAGICLMALAPRSPAGVVLLVGLGVISGCGVAIAHPEGLRAVHTLDRIPADLSTAVFMTSGFLGFASGGAVSASLVHAYGLKGLYPLILCVAAGLLAIALSGVRLAVEREPTDAGEQPARSSARGLPFWKVLGMGLPAAVSTAVILQLIPTHLHSMGFELTFGGLAAAMFGWGGVVGPFVWAAVARRRGDLLCSVWAFLLAAPFTILYLIFIERTASVWFLFGVGFSSMSAYILTITLAREARGLNLGQRMAFVVGGTWGIAQIAFLVLAPVADWIGTGPVLRLTPAGYLVSAGCAFWVLRRHPQVARPRAGVPLLELPGEERSPA